MCHSQVLEDVMWRTASKRMREAERVARMTEIMKEDTFLSLKSWRKWFTWLILCVDVCISTYLRKNSLLSENDKIGRCLSRTNPEDTLLSSTSKPPPPKNHLESS